MFSLNRVQLIGYQTQPVTVRQTPGGTSVTDLNLIVPVRFRADNGQMISGKSFHTVTAWSGLADVIGQFVKPGAQVFIAGRLQTDSWEDASSGEKRSKTKIIAAEMILLDPKGGQMPEPAGASLINGACNRADIVGNVSRDPELRTTTSGQKVVSMGVATNDRWKDKATGEMKEKSEFHNVVIWGDLADEVSRFVKKGNRVFVSGRVQTRSWETQAGAKRTTTEIIAESCSLLGAKNSVAEESIQADGTPRTTSAPAAPTSSASSSSDFGEDPSAQLPPIPTVEYASEIKVEDLPF